jgi:hypothetical protein
VRATPIHLPLVFAVQVALVAPALADDTEEARRLFDEGTAAIHDGHPARARDLLERSLALVPHQATVWNLILALDRSDGLRRAGELCDELLEGGYGELEGAKLDEARATCDGLAEATPQLVLVGTGASRIALHVDGETVGVVRDRGEMMVPVDPGRHVVRAAIPDGEVSEQVIVELSRGARERRVLEAPRAIDLGSNDPEPVDEGGGPWPWILGISGVAVVAAAVVLTVVLVSASSGPQPIEGDFPVTETLLGP